MLDREVHVSDRLADAFDFNGRLSFAGRQRLERKLLALALIPFLALAVLIMLGLRQWGALPFLLLVPLPVALAAAHVRRMHDLGLEAGAVLVRHLLAFVLFAAPAGLALIAVGLPDWVRLALTATSAVVILAGAARSLFVLPLDWRRGDPGPNRFGSPPE